MTSTYTANDAIAYERLMGRWSRLLAEQLIDFAAIETGDRILDLGCGTGSLALALAARREPAQIVGLDIAEPYIEYARARSADPRVTFRIAAAIDVPDGHFDRCYSLLALNFVTEPVQAVREMRRVTRPGGVIAAAVWDFAGGLTYQRLFWDTAAALDPAADRARARHYAAALTWPGELEAAFVEVGTRDVVGASLTMRMVYADFADYWEPIANAQGPVGDYVNGLEPQSLAALAAAVERAYLAGRPAGPRSMAATAWAAKGVA
ncbi:MAG: class I SAM-dependent methyltransferase [Alphaproteobacteria bacterium]|nr:class I SAM-dependent methyltransferase [Alphaproteobacteria bacterium]